MQQQQIKWEDVESSNIQQIAHDKPTNTLLVKFVGGGLYTYEGVDNEVYTTLANSASVGKYLNQAIKGSYPYLKHTDEQALTEHIKARRAQT